MRNSKALLITSDLGKFTKARSGEMRVTHLNNTSYFVDRLRELTNGSILNITYIPDSAKKIDANAQMAEVIKASFNLEGLGVENVTIIDDSFNGDILDTMSKSDLLYIGGTSVLSQNAFLKRDGLKDAIKEYRGIIITEGAGTINLSKDVYYQSHSLYTINRLMGNRSTRHNIVGLGLINTNVIPHYNTSHSTNVYGGVSVYDRSLEDSRTRPHFMISDGAFIEIDRDGSIRYSGKIVRMKDGKAKVMCEDGKYVIIPPRDNTNTK